MFMESGFFVSVVPRILARNNANKQKEMKVTAWTTLYPDTVILLYKVVLTSVCQNETLNVAHNSNENYWAVQLLFMYYAVEGPYS